MTIRHRSIAGPASTSRMVPAMTRLGIVTKNMYTKAYDACDEWEDGR